ncbi:MAG: hypothetical protein PPP55_11130 [Halorubrum sp.]
MIGTAFFAGVSPSVQALAVITIVLLEAVVLYIGYGALEEAVGPALLDLLAEQ